jgi:hypothetical protein
MVIWVAPAVGKSLQAATPQNTCLDNVEGGLESSLWLEALLLELL